MSALLARLAHGATPIACLLLAACGGAVAADVAGTQESNASSGESSASSAAPRIGPTHPGWGVAPGTPGPASTPSSSSSSSQAPDPILPPPAPSDTIYRSGGRAQVDGAIATDGNLVFWVREGKTGGGELVVCPASGCPASGPTVFWGSTNWGGEGELLVQGGRIYFQTPGPGQNGPIVSCPVSGCGDAPDTFVANATDSVFVPAFATDGSALYWADGHSIMACGLGDACALPRVVAKLGAHAEVPALTFAQDCLYWVDRSNVESVPTAGGDVATICRAPGGSSDSAGPGRVAVVGDYVYVSGTPNSEDRSGIVRCEQSGGKPTEYARDVGAQDILFDGTSLLWLSGWQGASPDRVRMCAPGAACPSWTGVTGDIAEVNNNYGFTAFAGAVYTVGREVRRTAY